MASRTARRWVPTVMLSDSTASLETASYSPQQGTVSTTAGHSQHFTGLLTRRRALNDCLCQAETVRVEP